MNRPSPAADKSDQPAITGLNLNICLLTPGINEPLEYILSNEVKET